jgi:CHAT domain-containing protein
MSAGPGVTKQSPEPISDEVLKQLGSLPDRNARSGFFQRHPELLSTAAVLRIRDLVLRELRADVRIATALAEAAIEIAQRLRDPAAQAQASRCMANALYANGHHRSALEHHARAVELFETLRDQDEVARTLSSSLQPMILLGEYDKAIAAADRARSIFTQRDDRWRLARLELNVGNIYHRQDRFAEALASYERAYQEFLSRSDSEGTAAALGNIATCLITLNDFERALKTYEQGRAFCLEKGMTAFVSQYDYNIAWLYYLRGNYSRAIEMLRATRDACKANHEQYHYALCHMDLSEIYLELNLSEEAAEMAREGAALFESLGMGYETAKCYANLATATGQQKQAFRAMELFSKAREIFVREKNAVWPSLIDLYQALLLFNEGRYFESRSLCNAALGVFCVGSLHGKAALCHLLLARIASRMSQPEVAARECASAEALVKQIEAPLLTFQTYFLLGELRLDSNDRKGAYESFCVARKGLETLRSSLRGQELKISFVKDRLEVYERLVDLCLSGHAGSDPLHEAFEAMEQAKSRSLIDLMFQAASVQPPPSGQSALVRNIRNLREELNWYYHRIEQEQLQTEQRSPERIERLQREARERETRFVRTLREMPSDEAAGAALAPRRTMSAEEVRAALDPNAAILEYFFTGEKVLATVITKESLQPVPVTLLSRVTNLLQLLQFQLSKFQLGPEYARTFEKQLLTATQGHLQELYNELIAPVRLRLARTKNLIVIPHGLLHYLPFHAFYDGERYLCDLFQVSYAPSASIFALCQQRTAENTGPALILGVPDARAPFILDEVQSVAGILRENKIFLGGNATSSKLREEGANAGVIHIATHGFFRQDNPMFSGIRLGDGYLSLHDLDQLKLPARLITLSGCATGLTTVAAGDELLGLVRGLLHAGGHSLLLSLWDIHDRTTSEFMKQFYSHYCSQGNNVAALQSAMGAIRANAPHPYYWAPFKLVGQVDFHSS